MWKVEVRTKKCDDDSLPDDRKTTTPIASKIPRYASKRSKQGYMYRYM